MEALMAVWKHHSDPTPNVTFRVQQYLQRKLIGLFGTAFAEDFGMFSKTFLQEVDDGKRWTDLLQEVCLDISAISSGGSRASGSTRQL